jgi:NAD(P)-dependent dehydrogenase (short-subunit alcohol dehydrogenase family)
MSASAFDFSGKVAVVTGGAHGIGLHTVNALAAGGASVWILDQETPTAVEGRFRRVDVSDPDAVTVAMREINSPDIVVANAGTCHPAELAATTHAQWERTLAINLSGVFHTVQAAAAMMKPRRRGSIVITASTNSFDGEASLIAYNASKAGLLGIVHTAANELGPYGIRVNAVCPGLIRTRLAQPQFDDPRFLKSYFQHIPLGRGGEPAEVAAAIAFLASDLASYITGTTLVIDGGQLASKFGTWTDEHATFEDGRWKLREG